MGTARRNGGSGNRGRPVIGEGSVLKRCGRQRPWRESDRVVGASRPGNAGGAKGPDFWHASEDGEVKVIGDEPANTDYDPGPSVEAHIARRRYVTRRVSSLDTSMERPTIVGLVVKPIGKPSAGNRHARFDERGWETGRWP